MPMGGLYYEQFSVGQRFEHVLRRTVTEADNLFFSALTHNPAALHLDEEAMKASEFGTRIVNSCFTLSLMVGVSVADTTLGTTVANLGWDEVRFPEAGLHRRHVAHGIDRATRCARASRGRTRASSCSCTAATTSTDVEVAVCKRMALMKKLPQATA